jgi:hypothetical protein
MGKYAPKKNCVNCEALDEMCMGCAMEWKEKQWDGELAILRRLARNVEKGARRQVQVKLVLQWKAHMKKRPPLKRRSAKATEK